MLGTNVALLNIFIAQRRQTENALAHGKAICWLCQGDWASVGCDHCFRYYHGNCAVADFRLNFQALLYLTNDGSCKFVSKCNECLIHDATQSRWEKETDFKKMTTRSIQRLIKSIWSQVLTNVAPVIDSAVKGLPKTWINCPINFDTINVRVKNGEYQYPNNLLLDIAIVNHNLRIVHRDLGLKEIMANFMATVYSLFNRCEACPYCLESSFSDRPKWITETCPWGHPLIFVDLKSNQSWPGKLLRYHEHLKLVDVLLFGSLEWYQVPAEDCHHFVTSDYAVTITSLPHKKAMLDSLRYLNNLVYCFPTKMTLNSRIVYPEIKDLIVISREQSTTSTCQTSAPETWSSINHEKWTNERVTSITQFIRTMEVSINHRHPRPLGKYDIAALDARRLLIDDSDEDEPANGDVFVYN